MKSVLAEFAEELRMRLLSCSIPEGEPAIHTFDRCVAEALAKIKPDNND